MNATIVAVDLAKSIFEIAAADADWRIAQRSRLPRSKFFGFFMQLQPCQVVMEACGSAHYWARRISELGHTVRLLPAHYVKAYVRRNKTDRADAAALAQDTHEIVVQVNGKLRGRISVAVNADEAAVRAAALADAQVRRFVADKPVRRVIVVPGKLVNVVV